MNMSDENTVRVELHDDGSVWQIMPDGSLVEVEDATDWERMANMTEAEIEANALSDPDNPPLTDEDLLRSLHMPNPHEIRERMGLSRLEFARRFHLSPYEVRKWEEGELWRNPAGMMILRLIDKHPEAVLDAIEQYRRFKSLEEVRAFVDDEPEITPPATRRYRAAG
jgi:putative transcriptional regulator